jgi:hypothetical protein
MAGATTRAVCPNCGRAFDRRERREFLDGWGRRKLLPCPKCGAKIRLAQLPYLEFQFAICAGLAIAFLRHGPRLCVLPLLIVWAIVVFILQRVRRLEIVELPLRPSLEVDALAADPDEATSYVDAWRRIITGEGKTWVVFRKGTCVVMMDPAAEPRAYAIELLRKWGPVHAGSSSGDFSVITLNDGTGWVVTCHHPDILTYVESTGGSPMSDVAIGMVGRSMRDSDAETLEVVHVENRP